MRDREPGMCRWPREAPLEQPLSLLALFACWTGGEPRGSSNWTNPSLATGSRAQMSLFGRLHGVSCNISRILLRKITEGGKNWLSMRGF